MCLNQSLIFCKDLSFPSIPLASADERRMIIVMTLNVGLFFAVTIGFFIGELAFGRIGAHFEGSGGC